MNAIWKRIEIRYQYISEQTSSVQAGGLGMSSLWKWYLKGLSGVSKELIKIYCDGAISGGEGLCGDPEVGGW